MWIPADGDCIRKPITRTMPKVVADGAFHCVDTRLSIVVEHWWIYIRRTQSATSGRISAGSMDGSDRSRAIGLGNSAGLVRAGTQLGHTNPPTPAGRPPIGIGGDSGAGTKKSESRRPHAATSPGARLSVPLSHALADIHHSFVPRASATQLTRAAAGGDLCRPRRGG